MKRKLSVLALILAIAFLSSEVYAYNDDILQGMWNKLTRGVVNALTGWLELPLQTIKGFKRGGGEVHDKLLGATEGFFKGIFCTVGRTMWGAVEIAGFWTANPKDNVDMGILLDAEYVWQENDVYSSLFNIREAPLGHMGRKLLRGLGNSLFGFAEFPGQIAKGFKNRSYDLGISKGLWFWYSREIYGLADLATIILPSPQENPGYAFEEEYPWDALAEAIE